MTDAYDEMSLPDRALMRALADAISHPRPPADLVARCEGLLGWIDVDAELATLLDQPVGEPVGARGSTSATDTLVFALNDGSCVIEVTRLPGSLHGQLLGGHALTVGLRTLAGSTQSVAVDEVGVFAIAEPPAGIVRLELEPTDDLQRIHTEWFVI